ncbi:MAG: polyphosphate kinase 1 [Phycisphaeraceae bacterium]|nr:MAG: polyphosphate kinase 1 [Phycisphaeraceae bacterium]
MTRTGSSRPGTPVPSHGAGHTPGPWADGEWWASAPFNRDISWLEFNRRVLDQALDASVPLLERVKFLAIFNSNLDEFFMKRVGMLKRQVEAGVTARTPEGLTPQELLARVRTLVLEQQDQMARCYKDDLTPLLAEKEIRVLSYADLSTEDRAIADRWYRANVFPVLTPLSVDPGHRFPFISNLSNNLGVFLTMPGADEPVFARVKIPSNLPLFVRVFDAPGEGARSASGPVRFIALREMVIRNLQDLFPGATINHVTAFRVTRNVSVRQDEEETEDLLRSVEQELRQRRFADAVRIEVQPQASTEVMSFVLNALELSVEDVYERAGPIDYSALWAIAELDRPDLKHPTWSPVTPPRLAGDDLDIFAAIRERDILLHHPYESFKASVERFIAAAARDPDVLAIKQTLYRTSRDSPFVSSLVRAAEEGKQVACLVELRARFDEQKNVRFARQLEKAGVHVAYGVVGLKTHCKCSLVVRKEPDGLRCYAHLGTGNYNPQTAHLYTDLSLLTCDPVITRDVVDLFNCLTGRSLHTDYKALLVAPFTMRDRLCEMIDREAANARDGKPARIWAKMNALEDRSVAKRLYEASRAGVEITLLVRGFCCLEPGVPGKSENIRVISVVGRFLEHSRIFHFANAAADPLAGDWYIGSADWMYRNLSARMEALTPVNDREARRRIIRIMDVMFADRRNAWDLRADGSYLRRTPDPSDPPDSDATLGTFEVMMRESLRSVGRA